MFVVNNERGQAGTDLTGGCHWFTVVAEVMPALVPVVPQVSSPTYFQVAPIMTHVKYGTVYIHNHDAIRNMVTFSFYKNRKPQPAESAEMFKTASAAAVRARHKEAAEAEAARVLQARQKELARDKAGSSPASVIGQYY